MVATAWSMPTNAPPGLSVPRTSSSNPSRLAMWCSDPTPLQRQTRLWAVWCCSGWRTCTQCCRTGRGCKARPRSSCRGRANCECWFGHIAAKREISGRNIERDHVRPSPRQFQAEPARAAPQVEHARSWPGYSSIHQVAQLVHAKVDPSGAEAEWPPAMVCAELRESKPPVY